MAKSVFVEKKKKSIEILSSRNKKNLSLLTVCFANSTDHESFFTLENDRGNIIPNSFSINIPPPILIIFFYENPLSSTHRSLEPTALSKRCKTLLTFLLLLLFLFDLVFIDTVHYEEYVDILLHAVVSGSLAPYLILHDAVPTHEQWTVPKRSSGNMSWCGTSYKAIFRFAIQHPETTHLIHDGHTGYGLCSTL